ncbi:MAG: glycosyltransferase [Thermoanaerobaculia bacterium]
MRIVALTNTYAPHVGGVARSVVAFTRELRRRGHEVLVVAPTFEGCPEEEEGVLRVPAIENFNGSNFSVPGPIPRRVAVAVKQFRPHLVHSHHPFLLGDTALRIGARRDVPVVFTHHTLYEHYVHYVPGGAERLGRMVLELVTGYCNLCDSVIAPSESVAALLVERGIRAPIAVIPTGVDLEVFGKGDGGRFRAAHAIPPDAFVVGHAGRLAAEKNLGVVGDAMIEVSKSDENVWAVVAGTGPLRDELSARFERAGVAQRVRMTGAIDWPDLADAYAAMDTFVFASRTETQGMVLTEAMAAGCPVVAVDATGAREVVRDGWNGFLLPSEELRSFVGAIQRMRGLALSDRRAMETRARATAAEMSLEVSVARLIRLYTRLLDRAPRRTDAAGSWFVPAGKGVVRDLKIAGNIVRAVGDAVRPLPGSDAGAGRIARWF